MVSQTITSKEEREHWNIEQYSDLLDKLYFLKGDLDEQTWNQLFVAIKNEVIQRFPPEDRNYQNMDF